MHYIAKADECTRLEENLYVTAIELFRKRWQSVTWQINSRALAATCYRTNQFDESSVTTVVPQFCYRNKKVSNVIGKRLQQHYPRCQASRGEEKNPDPGKAHLPSGRGPPHTIPGFPVNFKSYRLSDTSQAVWFGDILGDPQGLHPLLVVFITIT